MSTITEATSTNTTTTDTTMTNTGTIMPTTSFKQLTFTPTQAEIWVRMLKDTFAIHKITNEQFRMLETSITLTQEL